MKKYYLCLLMMSLLFITGCGNNSVQEKNTNSKEEIYKKITCINTNDVISDNTTVVLEYEDNYVKKATYTYNIKSNAEALANTIYEEFNKDFKDIKGVNSSFKNKKMIQTFDFEKIDLSQYKVAKTNYINFISNSAEKDFSYISEDKVLLNIYKDTELSNFTCK